MNNKHFELIGKQMQSGGAYRGFNDIDNILFVKLMVYTLVFM